MGLGNMEMIRPHPERAAVHAFAISRLPNVATQHRDDIGEPRNATGRAAHVFLKSALKPRTRAD